MADFELTKFFELVNLVNDGLLVRKLCRAQLIWTEDNRIQHRRFSRARLVDGQHDFLVLDHVQSFDHGMDGADHVGKILR